MPGTLTLLGGGSNFVAIDIDFVIDDIESVTNGSSFFPLSRSCLETQVAAGEASLTKLYDFIIIIIVIIVIT